MHFENMLTTFSGSTHKKDTRHALLPLIAKSSLYGRIFSLLKFTIGEGVHILPAQTKIVNHSPKYLIYHEWTKYSIK